MEKPRFKRIPKHIGVIPDGNRRWAISNGLSKKDGYLYGITPGFKLYELCLNQGIDEVTFYGFTKDNTKRPKEQRIEFTKACVDAVIELSKKDAELLVIGDTKSDMFPKELIPFTQQRKIFGRGGIKLNFLVNYGWEWDVSKYNKTELKEKAFMKNIESFQASRIDLIVRWGGRRRLSGFLPVQSVYSDFYIIDDLWPDFKEEHFYNALKWYENQDITLGG